MQAGKLSKLTDIPSGSVCIIAHSGHLVNCRKERRLPFYIAKTLLFIAQKIPFVKPHKFALRFLCKLAKAVLGHKSTAAPACKRRTDPWSPLGRPQKKRTKQGYPRFVLLCGHRQPIRGIPRSSRFDQRSQKPSTSGKDTFPALVPLHDSTSSAPTGRKQSMGA